MFTWMIAAAIAHDLDGSWVRETPEQEVRDAVEASAERSVSSLPGLFRSRARRKIASQARACAGYELTVDAQTVGWVCDDNEPFSVSRDQLGSPFDLQHEDQRVEATVTLDDAGLGARFAASGGRRTVRFALEGDTLVVTQEMHNDRLASPVRWEARYRRETSP